MSKQFYNYEERPKMVSIFKPKLFSLIKSGSIKEQISADIMAGIIVGIVALPLAIAFAVASGVSPEKGMITAIIAGFIISFLGGSRVQIGGPTGAFIIIVFGIVQQYGIDGLIIATILSGIILVIFGMLRLGSLLKFFPHPLIVGFTSGIALVILSTQVKDALGLEIQNVPSEFVDKWSVYYEYIHTINPYALGITLLTIFIGIYSKYITTKVPGSFIAIILMTLSVQFFDLPVTTIESFFGTISNEITFEIPSFDIANLSHYLAPALVIALLGSIESLLSAVVADGMIGTTHRSNTELVAQGIANIVTPFFGGIPATGAIARTATNVKNGGRTPIAGMTHAIVLFLIMMFFMDYAKLIPMSVLAGILLVVAYNMSEWRSFIAVLKGSPFDSIVLLSTFFLTVLVDLTVAIQVGIILSSLLFMKRMSDINTNIIDSEEDEENDAVNTYSNISNKIAIYEIAGPLFFASAKQYAETLSLIGFEKEILIIRLRHVPFIDSTALHNLESTIESLQLSGVTVMLTGANDTVYKELKRHKIIDLVEEKNVFSKFDEALKTASIRIR